MNASLLPSNQPSSRPDQDTHYYYEGESGIEQSQSILTRARRWLFRPPEEPRPQSQYFALVPLDDYRLRPRRTKLIVFLSSFLAVLLAALVFVSVPRGVTVGSIEVETMRMQWNKTLGTYQLQLQLTIPITNPNYVSARIDGNVSVAFYDADAGRGLLERAVVPRRAEPYALLLAIDASNVPDAYTFTILDQCSIFPRKLIFLLRGRMRAQYLFSSHALPVIDSYFMVECKRDTEGSMFFVEVDAAPGAAGTEVRDRDLEGDEGAAGDVFLSEGGARIRMRPRGGT